MKNYSSSKSFRVENHFQQTYSNFVNIIKNFNNVTKTDSYKTFPMNQPGQSASELRKMGKGVYG